MSTARSNPDVRARLIEATIRLLATTGPSEVKARSVSSEAGLSTMGVYTYFGGVPELLQSVADEGLRRLAAAFELVPDTDDPIADLCSMALAHREVARRNPHLYDLMFGLSIHGRYSLSWGTAAPVSSERSPAFKAAYSQLVKACTRLVDGNYVRKIDPSLIAMQLWSAVHGFVMLELADHFADVADPALKILVPMCNNLVVGLGAVRESVESSTATAIAEAASLEGRSARDRTQKSGKARAK
ncbi:TetR family transcriptional regulator [Paraburkholderia ginsengiterrae]|uniref:TetR family transcriptional regulator n=1 Tax=Paraburkholderia ginsengiterrae TaxID=1462993 RepID=A0A1A9MYV2_9BURK|nr:TetR-like C-terminal domain-containing protein [Paraburkholderia ginsengiterrae]OAJ52284.1 TetR family transcriptional regulator [Paraburkholderia ginsengiterrae]OAJ55219.1 TetR family transcriptional regulator [Paraburkholderia ginsengiterrae]